MNKKEKQKCQEAAEKARQWLASEEGKERLKEILERSKKARKRLEKARKVDWESLHTPMSR